MAECGEFHCDGECEWVDAREFHSELIQVAYTQVTGDGTDWTKCQTEPWWTLSGVLHGQTV